MVKVVFGMMAAAAGSKVVARKRALIELCLVRPVFDLQDVLSAALLAACFRLGAYKGEACR